MHIDEHLDAGRAMFSELAKMTRAYGMAGRVVAGHSSALSAMPPDDARRTIDELLSRPWGQRPRAGDSEAPSSVRLGSAR
jgi:hypothetical protein